MAKHQTRVGLRARTATHSPAVDEALVDEAPIEMPAYQVSLPVFEGPLDLLLHLIERQELDITQVSLARVTNQYLEYLGQITERNPDNLADFLVVAAKLLLIKSRVLLPQPPGLPSPEDTEIDVGEELIQQLAVYKRFKEAATWLKELEAQGICSFVRLAAPPPLQQNVDVGDIKLDDLLAAVREVLAIKPLAPSVNGAVPPVTISIADQMKLIELETSRSRSLSFRKLLEKRNSRLEVIVTLLALLELVKQLRVTMEQHQLFGDIVIVMRNTANHSQETNSRP
jgi:segregation and condensation protein A